MEKCLVQAEARVNEHVGRDPNPLVAQAPDAAPRNDRIRVEHADDNVPNTVLKDRIGAGRRLSVMIARFEVYVQHRMSKTVTVPPFDAVLNRVSFGMQPTVSLMKTLSDHLASFHDHAADHGVRTHMTGCAMSQIDAALDEGFWGHCGWLVVSC
jgi:hypothetical protein